MTHFRTCTLCEAMCGLQIELENGTVGKIRGDQNDPLSRGHICPKALALKDIHEDPKRLKQPLLKTDGQFTPISWNRALDHASETLVSIQNQYGNDAVATYLGNPNVHNLGSLIYIPDFSRTLRTRNRYSASSVDQWPHQHVGFEMYGHQFMVPIPDLDETEFLVIMGANPLASNGSMMTAPDIRKRLKSIVARGGQVVLIDPRRSETAALATQHLPIRPGTDVYLMAAIIRLLNEENLISEGPWASYSDGLTQLKEFVSHFDLQMASAACGIEPAAIRSLAKNFAKADRAAWYGRMGVSTQAFGATTQWLIQCVNILTNRLDQVGGVLFTRPAVSLLDVISPGHYGKWRSRVRGLAEFAGELPVICLAEEIETPGEGQIKGLVMVAGNPVVTTPEGPRLERAFQQLEFNVAIDFYINESNRHADLILPPTSPLERDHYDLIFHQFAVRNTAKFSPALFKKPSHALDDGEILAQLTQRLARAKKLPWRRRGALAFKRMVGARRLLDLALRRGPHKLRLGEIQKKPHGLDLGSLDPQLPALLPRAKIRLAPTRFTADLERVMAAQPNDRPLTLIGRRHLLTNNSWLRHVPYLNRDPVRCDLLIASADASAYQLDDGDLVRVTSATGELNARIKVSEEMMQGVVSLPHGFSQWEAITRPAEAVPANVNALTHGQEWDAVSGNAILNGVAVTISPIDSGN